VDQKGFTKRGMTHWMRIRHMLLCGSNNLDSACGSGTGKKYFLRHRGNNCMLLNAGAPYKDFPPRAAPNPVKLVMNVFIATGDNKKYASSLQNFDPF
jgi:hypothetical protein